MRIRQVRPEFFTDSVVSALPADVRLTYIGLWCVADDAGWMKWDAAQIGAQLYPYDTPKKRQKHLTEALDLLTQVGRLVTYECGCVEVPKLATHQKIGGNRATTVKDFHDRGHKWARKPDVKTQVLVRDGYACRYCGKTALDGVRIVLEHVVNGGPTSLDNCVTSCQGCNTKKGKRTLEEAGMTLIPLPAHSLPDASGKSQTDTPVTLGYEGNGTREDGTTNDDDRPALLEAFRRQGLPVDVAG